MRSKFPLAVASPKRRKAAAAPAGLTRLAEQDPLESIMPDKAIDRPEVKAAIAKVVRAELKRRGKSDREIDDAVTRRREKPGR